jgi:hypothetical protein
MPNRNQWYAPMKNPPRTAFIATAQCVNYKALQRLNLPQVGINAMRFGVGG